MEYNFDIEDITNKVKKVIQYSQNFVDDELCGVDAIIKDWLKAKQFFIEKMGGNLIYTFDEPISFQLDEEAKRVKMCNFSSTIEGYYDNWELYQFIDYLSLEDFYNNRTSKEYILPSGITVPKNFKVVKAFKFFETDIDKLKQMQSEASRIIQENVVSGYLCLSVHPLDFLSISENVHNWRSCHSLDGDYRSGNLNYMVDNTSFIVYLRADKQAILPHFPEDVPWNSKKWRTLFFLSNDKTLLFAGRQYPFTATKGLELVSKDILPRVGLGDWTSWRDTTISYVRDNLSGEKVHFSKMIPVGKTLKRLDKVIKNNPSTYQFNDLLQSSVYEPVWSYLRSKRYWAPETGCSNEDTEVAIGAPCICPICGKGIVSYNSIMLCPDCAVAYELDSDDYYECEICGSMTHSDDMYDLEYSNIRVCPSCYERETVTCQDCNTRDLPEQIRYRDGDSRCLCPDCYRFSRGIIEITRGR